LNTLEEEKQQQMCDGSPFFFFDNLLECKFFVVDVYENLFHFVDDEM